MRCPFLSTKSSLEFQIIICLSDAVKSFVIITDAKCMALVEQSGQLYQNEVQTERGTCRE